MKTPDELADICEAWLQTNPALANPVDAFEAGYRAAEATLPQHNEDATDLGLPEQEARALALAAARSTSSAEHAEHKYLQNITEDWQPHLWVVLAIQVAYRRGRRDQKLNGDPK
jgi:hypothetical protein